MFCVHVFLKIEDCEEGHFIFGYVFPNIFRSEISINKEVGFTILKTTGNGWVSSIDGLMMTLRS